MKCVGVRHKPEHKNIFWFLVPEFLEPITQIGSQVICDTKKGETTGVVMSILEGIDFEEENIKNFFKDMTLKKVIATRTKFNLADIHIPLDMERSSPSSDKIAKRVDEFYGTGSFKTPIICSPDGNLQDGYTAYLVAKMFGHDTLTVFCVNQS